MTKNLSSVKLRHSDTRAIRALGHLGYSGILALRHSKHLDTRALGLSKHFIYPTLEKVITG